MGYAAHRAVNTGLSPLQSPNIIQATKHGATLYTLQLGLNFLWMPLFFGIKNPFAATADILALGGTVGYLTYLWGQVDSVAGWCLAPYLGWLGYATYLTLGVCHLNNWNLKDKTVNAPPSTKPGGPTKFVDEKSI
jgi:benzodiazapine receptor